ncbi:MAG: DNA translocase FtsK 4TM domain-containing protein, partial [Solirubrobacteraceae bacterium]|nr:DNA translocase FtsK 4TM domain-containing protein [Solirubrobacteraceae bacterium]
MPKPPPRAQRRGSKPAPKTPQTPLLDQRRLDLVGLALIAFGVIVAIPLYRAGTGGLVGDAVADGARLLLGSAAYGAPALLIAGGLVAVSPLDLRACLRIAAGGACGFAAVTLIARAAAGPENAARWTAVHLRDAGGLLGESLWTVCHAAFGGFGPYVVAIVLILGAALLLTGAELASVMRGAGRGLGRAAAVPGRIRAERRADRAMALAEAPASVLRAAHEQEWERSLDAREADVMSAAPLTASATSGGTASGTATRTRRRKTSAPEMAPEPTAVVPADAPRTWTKRPQDPRTWTSAGGDPTGSGTLTPPELPGLAPTVRRTPRPAQLIDGAERFPDLFGGDGPIWIGPGEPGQELPPAAPAGGKYPDPLEDFEAELSAARHEDGSDVPDLPDERNGQFSEDADLVEEHGAVLDDPVLDDPIPGAAAVAEAELIGADDPAFDDGADDPANAPQRAPVGPQALTPMGRYRAEVTEAADFPWKIPPRRVLTRSAKGSGAPDRADQAQTSQLLLEALGHFGVQAEMVGCVSGPHITRYELRLAPGVKMNKVANLKDDLAYALAATDIRILAPIPGKTAVGVEVPNRNRAIVRLGDVFADAPPKSSPLTVWLGKDVEGQSVFADLAKMPHLLVAGTTGAGKSACINGMLSSILLSATPQDVRMVLVDPKQVELTPYASIPHLLTPVITSPKQAATALQNLVREMEARYSTMSLSKTRSLIEMNRVRRERGEQEFPYILCVIDEL